MPHLLSGSGTASEAESPRPLYSLLRRIKMKNLVSPKLFKAYSLLRIRRTNPVWVKTCEPRDLVSAVNEEMLSIGYCKKFGLKRNWASYCG